MDMEEGRGGSIRSKNCIPGRTLAYYLLAYYIYSNYLTFIFYVPMGMGGGSGWQLPAPVLAVALGPQIV